MVNGDLRNGLPGLYYDPSQLIKCLLQITNVSKLWIVLMDLPYCVGPDPSLSAPKLLLRMLMPLLD
jgi:hypothetical protein